jgi:hypothetical protein
MRLYKTKNPKKNIFCALCRTPRSLRYDRHLSAHHYLQILVLSAVLFYLAMPLMGAKGALILPVVWIAFESVRKLLYRKELACPHCGFDPTWYRRDVRLARQKVESFLKEHPESHLLLNNSQLAKQKVSSQGPSTQSSR